MSFLDKKSSIKLDNGQLVPAFALVADSGEQISSTSPLPVDIQGATLSLDVDGVEIKNDVGNPIPTVTGLKIPHHDEINLGYTGDDLTSVEYKLNDTTVATLTLTYSNGNLTKVERS